jgi:hypothetical protein
MSPRTQTQPLDDPRMWRRLVALAHPDAGGGHELFIWTATVKDAVCGGGLQVQVKPEPSYHPPWREASTSRPHPADDKPRIPYPVGTDFEEGTRRALRVKGPYSPVLARLTSCYPVPHLAYEEARGASYKRLAAIAHTYGMTSSERSGWYRCAESIPLSDRHAGHIISKLKRPAA